jgi:hypothetical protein
MVYDHLLPKYRSWYFPVQGGCVDRQRAEQDSLVAVCAAHPRIKDELGDFVCGKCAVFIEVSPAQEFGETPPILLCRFKRIEIDIYQFWQSSLGPDGWTGVRDLVGYLCEGNASSLPDITIKFNEWPWSYVDPRCENEWNGCPHWTEDVSDRVVCCYDGSQASLKRPKDLSELRTGPIEYDSDLESVYYSDTDSGCSAMSEIEFEEYLMARPPSHRIDTWSRMRADEFMTPVVMEILDHFIDLPPCKSGEVRALRGLVPRRDGVPRRTPEYRIFDDLYMTDLFKALELWLHGDREGVKLLPKDVAKGEPRWSRWLISGGLVDFTAILGRLHRLKGLTERI